MMVRHKGSLKKCGYSLTETDAKRHKALRCAYKRYGRDELIKKVNFLRVVFKNKPKYRSRANKDFKYIERL